MQKRNILITGGELFNKGAQAMTFVTVDEMKNRFPEHEVILISSRDYYRDNIEKSKYQFTILYDIFKTFFGMGLYSKLKRMDLNKVNESKTILSKTDIVIDISGFALSSNWGPISTLFYLSRIKTAKRNGAKVFLMPQSFGPFKYNKIIQFFIDRELENSLRLADLIYAREKEGYILLTEKYGLRNVELSPDLVLQNSGINLSNIYSKVPSQINIDIRNNSVAIVPNMRNFEHGNKEEIIELYKKSVEKLLSLGKNIYLIRHSCEDIVACEIIKSLFPNNGDVILLVDDYSCIDYENIVRKFDFILASRYHSIVHAYREGIPCIALGWATKYHELLERYEQGKYVFDVRKGIDYAKYINKIELMNMKYDEESDVILQINKRIIDTNIFNNMKLDRSYEEGKV